MKSFLESMVVIWLWEKSRCPLLSLAETLRWVEGSQTGGCPPGTCPSLSETHTPLLVGEFLL